jgi:hypothetical protein
MVESGDQIPTVIVQSDRLLATFVPPTALQKMVTIYALFAYLPSNKLVIDNVMSVLRRQQCMLESCQSTVTTTGTLPFVSNTSLTRCGK